MNVPNWITMIRLVSTIVVFALLAGVADPAAPHGTLTWWAFGLFLFAAITDFVDGYLARRLNQVSMFGRVFDPFVDKVLICGTFVMLMPFPALHDYLPEWFVVVLVGRELLVTTIRGAAESRGMAFPAERLGKYKMVAQSATAGAMLGMIAGTDVFVQVAVWGFWVTLVLTVISGAGYVWKARALLRDA
ncbi:MAG: CDP-diacylglycerol--glycerol-3-phosphate 3-phosphatidyltransferase [Planctomycetes bacterium]|nr:CDP-diacylglycerol--glycerol-3-phosphate 3-phosphatidyltransferase [Planctomycetota bacterium]